MDMTDGLEVARTKLTSADAEETAMTLSDLLQLSINKFYIYI